MRATLLVLSLLLVGCAGTPPPPQIHYLLRADTRLGTSRVDPPLSIGLRRVEVASYLKQSGLVIATGDHTVRPARYHQWADPLDEGLRRYLRAEISSALGYDVSVDPAQRGHWEYAVEVSVDQLHGTVSGEALLVASWRITREEGGDEVGRLRFRRSAPLARDGYPALVEAEIGLVDELAAAIADSLRELGGKPAAD